MRRWDGDRLSDINGQIAAGNIDFVVTNGGLFTVSFDAIENYTYVYQPVPEPHHVPLAAASHLASDNSRPTIPRCDIGALAGPRPL